MLAIPTAVQSLSLHSSATPGDIPVSVFASESPVVIKGLVRHWPAVSAHSHSFAQFNTYLRHFYRDATVIAFAAKAEAKGRYFYNHDMSGFNFAQSHERLDVLLDQLQAIRSTKQRPSLYVGSTTIDRCLPGFRAENDLNWGDENPLASIWLGNQSRIAAHYDVPDNIACVVTGRRRFTLFPPDQLPNLYVGPLDFTPAGQAISLVDFHEPDYQRFPKFRDAVQSAQVAELGPGDAIFIPSMWWHHVEALDDFNVLINYWWRSVPKHMGPPINVLMHALLSLRDLPPAQRQAWKQILDHYIFNETTQTHAHIPDAHKGVLGEHDEKTARQLRSQILNALNR